MTRFSRFLPSRVTNFSSKGQNQFSISVGDTRIPNKNKNRTASLLSRRQNLKKVSLRVPSVPFPLTNSESSSQSANDGHLGTKLFIEVGETDSTVSRLPEEHERLSDCNLEMSMLDGTWNMRRVVWTKSKIAFARVGEEMMMDAIPLDQVDSIQAMVHGFDSSSAVLESYSDVKRENSENPIAACPRWNAPHNKATKFVRIHTVPDGFNSGRPYFLRFPDEERCHQVAHDLTQLADAERRRVEAKSRFERHQASAAHPPRCPRCPRCAARSKPLRAPQNLPRLGPALRRSRCGRSKLAPDTLAAIGPIQIGPIRMRV